IVGTATAPRTGRVYDCGSANLAGSIRDEVRDSDAGDAIVLRQDPFYPSVVTQAGTPDSGAGENRNQHALAVQYESVVPYCYSVRPFYDDARRKRTIVERANDPPTRQALISGQSPISIGTYQIIERQGRP